MAEKKTAAKKTPARKAKKKSPARKPPAPAKREAAETAPRALREMDANPAAAPAPASPQPATPATPPPAAAPDPPASPDKPPTADFPRSVWASADYMLHHPREVMESIRRDEGLLPICGTMAMVSFAMAAVYGAVMGATNLLQGADMAMGPKLLLIGITAIKTPLFFLLTMGIVFLPIYVSNTFAGSDYTIRQVLAMLLVTITITTITLASMSTVAFFFALTTRSYDMIKLIHVAFFGYAGVAGLWAFFSSFRWLGAGLGRRTSRLLLILWIALYGFVGLQLGWVLRPFVGSPDLGLTLFRTRESNIYESVLGSIGEVLRGGE